MALLGKEIVLLFLHGRRQKTFSERGSTIHSLKQLFASIGTKAVHYIAPPQATPRFLLMDKKCEINDLAIIVQLALFLTIYVEEPI